MDDVPILVVEDKPFPTEDIPLPYTENNFTFIKHSCVKEKIDPESGREIFDRYKKFLSGGEDGEWGTLKGPAIIIMDLGYENVPLLSGDQIEDKEQGEDEELRGWVGEYTRVSSQQKAGLYLVGKALDNEAWHGVIQIATTLGASNTNLNQAVKNIDEGIRRQNVIIPTPTVGIAEQVVKKDEKGTPYRMYPNVESVIHSAIESFVERFGSIEKRIWPVDKYEGEPKSWFKKGHSLLPHNPPTGQKKEKAKQVIKNYLETLFMFDPPEVWFEEEQFRHLYKDLQHLLGADSTSHNNGHYNITLGNLVILLAATCGEKYAERWIYEIEWGEMKRCQQILPSQSKEKAREAIISLLKKGGLFNCIKEHKNKVTEEDNKKPIIDSVKLRENKLSITLDFDYTDENDGWSLRDKLLELPDPKSTRGDTFKAICEFIKASGVNEAENPERRCVLNWSQEGEGQTVLTIKPVAT